MARLKKANRPAIGDLKMFLGTDDELSRQLRLGWAVADGLNGTVNFIDKFPKFNSAASRGVSGGEKTVKPAGSVSVSVANKTLSIGHMANHDHTDAYVKGNNVSSGGSVEQRQSDGHKSGAIARTNTGTKGGSAAHNHGGSGSFSGTTHTNEPQHLNVLPLQFIGRVA